MKNKKQKEKSRIMSIKLKIEAIHAEQISIQAFIKLVVACSCSQKSISKENESKHDPTEEHWENEKNGFIDSNRWKLEWPQTLFVKSNVFDKKKIF